MNKRDLYKKIGSMQQLAYIRPICYGEGRAHGMSGFQVKNGPLSFQVMADKCLDVSEASYKGITVNFLSKPGLQGRNQYDTNGQEALRSIMGGLFFTSGLENICAPCRIGETDYPMHGRARTTPAEHVCADACWENGEYRLSIRGEMREAELFGENMVLRREISSVYGQDSFTLRDEIQNESYRPEPMMLLYHINLGYPFLDESTRLYLPTRKVTPRDPDAEGHEQNYDVMDAPKENEPEYVFIHELQPDAAGNVSALAVNETLEMGVKISWNTEHLPYFMEWKSTAAGDYVIGLEPANSSVYGRPWHEERNSVHTLEPFEGETIELNFAFFDGKERIEQEIQDFKKRFQI